MTEAGILVPEMSGTSIISSFIAICGSGKNFESNIRASETHLTTQGLLVAGPRPKKHMPITRTMCSPEKWLELNEYMRNYLGEEVASARPILTKLFREGSHEQAQRNALHVIEASKPK
jgi:hypothetical protein